jgi:hypothetical protein
MWQHATKAHLCIVHLSKYFHDIARRACVTVALHLMVLRVVTKALKNAHYNSFYIQLCMIYQR